MELSENLPGRASKEEMSMHIKVNNVHLWVSKDFVCRESPQVRKYLVSGGYQKPPDLSKQAIRAFAISGHIGKLKTPRGTARSGR